MARRVITRAGAERIAQVHLVFNPEFQRLDVHYVRVIRGTETIDHTDIDAFEMLRREKNLEKRILDGSLTATLIVPGVYVGDIIETCWTVYDCNPLLRGRFAYWLEFNIAEPALAIRQRLLSRRDQNIEFREFGGVPPLHLEERGSALDRSWRAERVSKLQVEPLTPPWQVLGNRLQASELPDWNTVTRALAPYYAPDSYPESFRTEIGRIVDGAGSDPLQRAGAILRFVQQRQRYLSLSLGRGGYVPRPVKDIWETGYGDCKDAARLLVAAATIAEIDAFPALVSARYGPALNAWLPSLSAFDHCIVKLLVEGRSYWVDPTLRAQKGPIDHQSSRCAGWALLLAQETMALEQLDEPAPVLLVDASERMVFGPRVDSPASLIVQAQYFAISADGLRDQIANQGHKQYADNFRKTFEAEWPSLTEKEPISIEDADDENRIVVTANFEIRNAWKESTKGKVAARVVDHFMGGSLVSLAPNSRSADIFLGTPRILRRRLEAIMPMDWGRTSGQKLFEAPGLSFRKDIYLLGRRCVIQEQELRIGQRTLPPQLATRYSEIAKALQDRVLLLTAAARGTRFKKSQRPLIRVILAAIWFAIILLLISLASH